jgi:hypothetical protein
VIARRPELLDLAISAVLGVLLAVLFEMAVFPP